MKLLFLAVWSVCVWQECQAAFAEWSFVENSKKECVDAGGTCQFKSTCEETSVKWLCDGLEECCFKTEKLCETGGGRCQPVNTPCTGPYLHGACGMHTSSRCCFETDITQIETSGASGRTAKSYRLRHAGVAASHSVAEMDLRNLLALRPKIMSVARATGVDASLIAAIISRESRGDRSLLDEEGYARTKTRAYGGMQMKHRVSKDGPFSEEHFLRATELLIRKIQRILKSHPNWSKEYILKGAVAAYNMGEMHVWTIKNMDKGTNNDDYANDVIARAQWFKTNGYFELMYG